MNLFKKKTEEPKETPIPVPVRDVIAEKIIALKEYTDQLEHYRKLKVINDAEYEQEMIEIGKQLDAIEGIKPFDDMMGNPMLTFPEIFGDDAFDEMVHRAVEECESESNTGNR